MRTVHIAGFFLATLLNVGFAQNTPKPGIRVALNRQDPLRLRVSLTSGAAKEVTLNRADLPWGNRYSMVFTVLRPNGERVEMIFPEDEPGTTEVSIKPGETLAGDIDLRDIVGDLNAMKKSDVLLFWAYQSPDELRLPKWSGGLVLLPKRK